MTAILFTKCVYCVMPNIPAPTKFPTTRGPGSEKEKKARVWIFQPALAGSDVIVWNADITTYITSTQANFFFFLSLFFFFYSFFFPLFFPFPSPFTTVWQSFSLDDQFIFRHIIEKWFLLSVCLSTLIDDDVVVFKMVLDDEEEEEGEDVWYVRQFFFFFFNTAATARVSTWTTGE